MRSSLTLRKSNTLSSASPGEGLSNGLSLLWKRLAARWDMDMALNSYENWVEDDALHLVLEDGLLPTHDDDSTMVTK